MMKKSLMGLKPQVMAKSQSAGYIKPRKRQSKKLPSLKQRYGQGVVSGWQKGPIDMPKVHNCLFNVFCNESASGAFVFRIPIVMFLMCHL